VAESTTRVEAFSDGVFAIAITLLILEIRVPGGELARGASLAHGLAELWPSYLAFLLSFIVILISWVNHHELMRLVRVVDYRFLFANGFVLLTITFIPFPTAVLAAHLADAEARTAAAFYCGTFVVASIAWGLLLLSIKRRGRLRHGEDAVVARRVSRAYAAGPLIYGFATVVAFYNAVAGLAINLSLWILWLLLCYRAERPEEPGEHRA
jgi:uncharacterized membrane protein